MASTHLEDVRALIGRLTILRTQSDADRLISQLLALEGTRVLSFLNQHALNLAAGDPAFLARLCDADCLLRDGVGIEVALRYFGSDPGLNANGTDFIPRLLGAAGGTRSVALLGTRSPWLERAARVMENRGTRVVATLDGFRDASVYPDLVELTDPDIVILGMGMPRQEAVASELARLSRRPRLIVNGGAIIDFYASRFRRAPLWMQSARLEWMFRLVQEPRRLSGRYLGGGGRFAVTLARLKSTQKQAPT